MASIQFRLRSKANKNVSIKIRLTIGRGKDLETNTGFTINPKDWSNSTSMPKQNSETNKKLINDLKKLESHLHSKLNEDSGNGTLIDVFWLQNQIDICFERVKKNDIGLLTNHIQYIIDNSKTRKVSGRNQIGISISRVKGYKTFKNLTEEYQRFIKKEINFLDINKAFTEKFTNWLLNTKKYSTNYAGKQIDNLKTVSLDAEKLDIPTNPYIKNIESFTESNEDRYIVTLSFDELEQIRLADIKSKALQNARKWLLIGCEIGQRGGDLLNITQENIRYNKGRVYLDIIQQKTKKDVTIGIINSNILDILENEFPYKISSQKLNEYIKDVCKEAGINEIIEGKKFDEKTKRKVLDKYPKHELITSHSFRRSFATNYYKKIPTPILITITGHSKESLFLQYINRREDKDANADLYMQFYEQIQKEREPKLKVI